MANKIILKKSSEASKAPQTSDLEYGELALNFTDGKLYFKNSSNVIESFHKPVWLLNGTDTYYNNGNVGIGLNNPSSKFEISDSTLSGSGSLASSIISASQTWNTTGTPTAIKLNVTDTTSNANSLLLDLQVSTISKFKVNKNGDLTVAGDATVQGTLFETSDVKLKKDVTTITQAIDSVCQLRGVTFKWIKNDKDSMGLIAQETEKIIPFIVQEDPTGSKSINYTALIGLLVEAIKELNGKIDNFDCPEPKIPPITLKKETQWSKFKKFFKI